MHKILQQYTSRPIYDRSYHGFGINHMLYQLKNPKLYQIIKDKPHTIIYVYIPEHIGRLYSPCMYSIYEYYGAFFTLDKDKNLIHRTDFELYNRFNLVARIHDMIYRETNFEKLQKFLYYHLADSKKEVDKHWNGSKFIILEYFSDNIFSSIKPDLEQLGFTIINRNELVEFYNGDENYCLSKIDRHPS